MDKKELDDTLTKIEHWQKIIFEDDSNPYICKSETEFERIAKKYTLKETGTPDWWIAVKNREENNNENIL